MRRLRVSLLLLLGACALGGCASLPGGKHDPRDPYERFNRSIYRFNNAVDKAVIRPLAVGYVKITPAPVRTGLSNFFSNIAYPGTIVNELLQGKVTDSGRDTFRLIFNTIWGLGFFDPATGAGFEKHNEDFGLTFGHWGIHPGPYLLLPILGPSNIRDGLGLIPDGYTNARVYLLRNFWEETGAWAVAALGERADLLDQDQILKQAYDPYAFMRNAYLQHRDYRIHGDQAGADADTPTLPDVPTP
jgi:phospholipid-binding lipoprotein MlaA